MKITDLKDKIPHGGIVEIAKRAGVHKIALTQYFSGQRRIGTIKELKLIEITLEYLKEIKDKKEELQKKLEELEQ
jgi:hypothetical protein